MMLAINNVYLKDQVNGHAKSHALYMIRLLLIQSVKIDIDNINSKS